MHSLESFRTAEPYKPGIRRCVHKVLEDDSMYETVTKFRASFWDSLVYNARSLPYKNY